VEYKFEKKYEAPPVTIVEHHYSYPWYIPYSNIIVHPSPLIQSITWNTLGGNFQSGQYNCATNLNNTMHSGAVGTVDSTTMNCSLGSAETLSTKGFHNYTATVTANQMNVCRSSTIPENTAGITVPGSESNQQFYSTYDFACESSDVIVLKMIGKTKNATVAQPITVDYKPVCTVCGHTNRATHKFCSECSASLTLF
jgi:hypothetical protein